MRESKFTSYDDLPLMLSAPEVAEVGFSYNDVLSFTEGDDGQSVIIRKEDICCGCKEKPPLVEERNLQDVLADLTFEEQMAAFFFLTRLLSDRQTR